MSNRASPSPSFQRVVSYRESRHGDFQPERTRYKGDRPSIQLMNLTNPRNSPVRHDSTTGLFPQSNPRPAPDIPQTSVKRRPIGDQRHQGEELRERLLIINRQKGDLEQANAKINQPKEERRDASEKGQFAIREKLRHANEEIERLKKEKEEAVENWKIAANEIHSLKAERNYNRDDGYFINEWKSLSYNIRNWASLHFAADRSLLSNLNSKDDFKSLTGDYKTFLRDKNRRALLMQSYLWDLLGMTVFASCTDDSVTPSGLFWAGKVWESFQDLQLQLRHHGHFSNSREEKAYHAWRTTTAALIQNTIPITCGDPRIAELTNSIRDKLRPYVPEAGEAFERGLINIISQAAQLDAEMQKQTAVYFVQTWRLYDGHKMPHMRNVTFNSASMETVEGNGANLDSETRLTLVVCPMLLKGGNASGGPYDVRKVLVKGIVAIDRTPHSNSGRGATALAEVLGWDPGSFNPGILSSPSSPAPSAAAVGTLVTQTKSGSRARTRVAARGESSAATALPSARRNGAGLKPEPVKTTTKTPLKTPSKTKSKTPSKQKSWRLFGLRMGG